MTVGQRIKQRRLELGWTQDELAEKMGYKGKSAVCMAETKGDNITTTKVKKFAKALGVSPRYLMGYDSDKTVEINIIDPDNVQTKALSRALKMYEMYSNSAPEIQSAIETLLKSSQENK